ncbi:uncharacterized protein FFB20_08955 [Fusarium fujikuroi]|uniref:Uncharacterized protein n=1 Tax=Gibberella fujikuroi (strain CBS 195.34 / IMI 58289 / NRRL A-6831) TaxID=1279085 RepID=S0DJA8_GIBF5|nr:uncharacterized protein FFUJ_01128 [Fusarium fujikuroi IMI 58289]SCN67736.1 uncharacterized protein FFE2_01210 [Fusarium fujikuroi]CCT62331.1 uncharacterized protein FFUJ_01128 [Fusarium fujikuroi IMI 58289]SCN71334.1 uncharacterized protein FFC1_01206 [Fusarium fujikuroi]SCN75131.1 uncharacterized protein FFM5_01165 [Fusarium fujikuroi]SCN91318.1 uncharacterized protein FFB20_08955 [Fusarium fujikuroi]
MCLDIYHDYQECGHHRYVRTYTCWQDRWEMFCPCLSFHGVIPYKNMHSSTENRQVRLGSCPNCEASKKKRERRDYGGFTAQQTHGAGASHGRGQLQTTQPTGGHQELRVPERAHQPGAYRQEPRMHMASQSRPSDRVYTSPPGVYIPHHSPAPSQGARQVGSSSRGIELTDMQPRRQYSDPHASSSKRERAVRGQQVGNKVIVDKGVPLPPQGQYKTPDTSRSRTVRNSPRRVGSVRDRVDRSHTVSPLTEDERNAPYVEIPSHDEYAGWV